MGRSCPWCKDFVVAIEFVARDAFATDAKINKRAAIRIGTARRIICVCAALGHVASVIGARILVVANDRRAAAKADRAGVFFRARVVVVARRGVLGVDASRFLVTTVICAYVGVIAYDCHTGATAQSADIVLGASRIVVAGFCVFGVKAGLAVALVVRARVQVIASTGIDVVGRAVAIVVYTVASFRCWIGRVARAQARITTSPHTAALSKDFAIGIQRRGKACGLQLGLFGIFTASAFAFFWHTD